MHSKACAKQSEWVVASDIRVEVMEQIKIKTLLSR